MNNEYKKIIYYYYDEKTNRRPIGVEEEKQLPFLIDNSWIAHINRSFPETTNNLYMQVDGVEFKLN